MKNLTQVPQISSKLSDRTITINLILRGDARISVRSCEVLGRGFRNRTSFQNVAELNDVLVAPLANAIRNSISTISDGAQVLSLPEFLVELPGLALSGAHVIIMEATDGARNAILRFKDFIGSINNAFRPDIGFQEPYATHSEKLAANVLADICLPLLNLCREMDFAEIAGRGVPTADLLAKAREFEFQAELLKRFVYNAGTGYADPTLAHVAQVTHPPEFKQIG